MEPSDSAHSVGDQQAAPHDGPHGFSTQGPLGAQYAPLQPLNPDGLWGKETANAVKSYQNAANRLHGCAEDDRVDPAYTMLSRLGGDPIAPSIMRA